MDNFNEGPEILCMQMVMVQTGADQESEEAYLCVGGNSKRIQVFHTKSGDYDYFMSMDGHEDSVTCMALDGNVLITGSDDKNILTWNTREWFAEHHKEKKKNDIKIIYPERKEPMRGHNDGKY